MHSLTESEKAWIEEHGCIHGLFPDESPIFCPNCKPDPADIFKMLENRCNRGIKNEKTV